MRMGRVLVLGLAAAATAIAQDLPPGVLLLSQVKRHVEQQLQDLRNYTCLETIHRYYDLSGRANEMQTRDTVRLEVLYAGKKELYSSPGERNFSAVTPSEYVTNGMSQDGLFGGYLDNIVVGGTALLTYRGEEELNGIRTARYDFSIPGYLEPLELNLGPLGRGNVGLKGTFWADPESKNVLRLAIQPDDIPASLPVASGEWVLNYAAVRIGEYDIMVPQSVVSQMQMRSGQIDRNVLELTHCRAFEAESSISFGSPASSPSSAPPPPLLLGAEPGAVTQFPAGVRLTVTLQTTVNEKTPVGTPLEARLADVVQSHSRSNRKTATTAIPDGALVRGRVRRVEKRAGADGLFLVALEFCDVEVDGAHQRFFADLESAERLPGVEAVVTAGSGRATTLPDLPGVAYLMIHQGVALPAGFTTVWKTASLTPDPPKQ